MEMVLTAGHFSWARIWPSLLGIQTRKRLTAVELDQTSLLRLIKKRTKKNSEVYY